MIGALSEIVFLRRKVASFGNAEQPQRPCHPNPFANQDAQTVRNRGDIRQLPDPLKDQLARMASRPHSQLPTQAYAEAQVVGTVKPKPSQLVQYYLLNTTGFQANPFTAIFPGLNDR